LFTPSPPNKVTISSATETGPKKEARRCNRWKTAHRNMREENLEQAHDTAVQSSPSSNGPQCDLIEFPQSPRLRTMASSVGNTVGSSKRYRGARGFKTRTALLSVLAAASPVAMAENCISLSGSTECPAFSSASISTDSTLVGFLYGFSQSKECTLDC
jgi:hypothetical protein